MERHSLDPLKHPHIKLFVGDVDGVRAMNEDEVNRVVVRLCPVKERLFREMVAEIKAGRPRSEEAERGSRSEEAPRRGRPLGSRSEEAPRCGRTRMETRSARRVGASSEESGGTRLATPVARPEKNVKENDAEENDAEEEKNYEMTLDEETVLEDQEEDEDAADSSAAAEWEEAAERLRETLASCHRFRVVRRPGGGATRNDGTRNDFLLRCLVCDKDIRTKTDFYAFKSHVATGGHIARLQDDDDDDVSSFTAKGADHEEGEKDNDDDDDDLEDDPEDDPEVPAEWKDAARRLRESLDASQRFRLVYRPGEGSVESRDIKLRCLVCGEEYKCGNRPDMANFSKNHLSTGAHKRSLSYARHKRALKRQRTFALL